MKKGFTLIELSIVLIIIGLLTGGSFQLLQVMEAKARDTQAKQTLEAAKEAIIGFAINNNRLPNPANPLDQVFLSSLVSAGNTPIYYNSDAVLQANLCDRTATVLNTTDINGINTPNIAFVLAVAGENMLGQTTRVGNNITFPQWNAPVGGRGYDDFHTQVSLNEIQSLVECQAPTIINPTLHNGTVGTPYTVQFVGNGGNGVYTFARTAGAYPPGAPAFALDNATGILTGTPTTVGTSVFTIQITSGTISTTRQFALVVN